MVFSAKQLEVIKNTTCETNLIEGSIRAGKTHSIQTRLYHYFRHEPSPDTTKYPFIFMGDSTLTLERNFLAELQEKYGRHFYYNSQKAKGTLFGKPFVCFGYSNMSVIKKIRGITARGFYIYESCFCPLEIYLELIGRGSVKNSKGFLDTNPDNPFHWIKERIIDNKEAKEKGLIKHIKMTMDDNPSLSDEYKERIKRLYKKGTLTYNRKILGLWVAGEGVVFDCFNPSKHVVIADSGLIPLHYTFQKIIIGIDHGVINPTCFLKIGYLNGCFWVYDEYYYDSKKHNKQKLTTEYRHDLACFLDQTRNVLIFCDPAAAELKAELKKNLYNEIIKLRIDTNYPKIRNAFNFVDTGIQYLNTLFSQNKIFISSRCVNLLRELSNYVWDKKALLRNKEQPLKENDHSVDALRYAIASYYRKLKKQTENKNYQVEIEYDREFSEYG